MHLRKHKIELYNKCVPLKTHTLTNQTFYHFYYEVLGKSLLTADNEDNRTLKMKIFTKKKIKNPS